MTVNKDNTNQNDDQIAILYRRYQQTRDITPAATLIALRDATLAQRIEPEIHTLLELAKTKVTASAASTRTPSRSDSSLFKTIKSWIFSLSEPRFAVPALATLLVVASVMIFVPQTNNQRFAYLSDCATCLDQLQNADTGFRSTGTVLVNNQVRNAAKAGVLAAAITMLEAQTDIQPTTTTRLMEKLTAFTMTLADSEANSVLNTGASLPDLETIWQTSERVDIYNISKANTLARISALAYQTAANSNNLTVWQAEHQVLAEHLRNTDETTISGLLIKNELLALTPDAQTVERLINMYRNLDTAMGL